MTNPPFGHDPYSLPSGSGEPAQPPGSGQPAQPPEYPVSGSPGAYPPYGSPQGQPGTYSGYGQPPVPYGDYAGGYGDYAGGYGGYGGYGQPASGPPQPYSPYAAGYPAAYGYDPVTGQPLSDKSKVVAGLLQLLLGALFAFGGVGRLYAGNTSLGVIQLVVSVIGWVSFWCGFVLVVPFLFSFGIWVWFVVDGIVMLAGRPVDGQGRLLRS